MGNDDNGGTFNCVLADLNTQRDFFPPGGARPVANATELIPALRRVVAWVRRNGVPVIASVNSHRHTELPERGCPLYCVDGTAGQRKLDFTLLPQRVGIQVDNTLAVPPDLFITYQQVVFRQRGEDLLDNPKADRFLSQLPTREFFLFGNTVETAVKAMALGLVSRHSNVTVIRDACGYWDRAAADLAFRMFEAKGVRLCTVDDLYLRKLGNGRRYRLRVFRARLLSTTPSRDGNGTVRPPVPKSQSGAAGRGRRNGTASSGRRTQQGAHQNAKLPSPGSNDTIPPTPRN